MVARWMDGMGINVMWREQDIGDFRSGFFQR
jgi:hypothetical protein